LFLIPFRSKPERVRQAKIIVTNILVVTLAAFFAAAEDNTQVIRTQKSVLSIYSVGGADRMRVAPELPERGRRNQDATGSLTDVVSTPPLSSSLRTRSATSHPTFTKAGAKGSGKKAQMGRANAIPQSLSDAQTVTVGWDSSPDQSVAGYYLYIGNASRQYTGKHPVGNQTSASVAVGEGAVYLAVSAYTAEGFESALSQELVLNANPSSAAAASDSLSRSAD
jgi:hypothetical protein